MPLWINQRWENGAFNVPADGPYIRPRPWPGYLNYGRYWDRYQGDGVITNYGGGAYSWDWVPNSDLPLENYLSPDQISVLENVEVVNGKLTTHINDENLGPWVGGLELSTTCGPYSHDMIPDTNPRSTTGVRPGGTWNYGLPPTQPPPRAVCFVEAEITATREALITSPDVTSWGSIFHTKHGLNSNISLEFWSEVDNVGPWTVQVSYYRGEAAPGYWEWIELPIWSFDQTFLDAPHVWRLEWQTASYNIDFDTWDTWEIASDGYLALFIDGVEIWSDRDAPFIASRPYDNYWDPENISGISAVALGLWGVPGDYGYVKAGYLEWLDIANFNEVLLDSTLFNGRIPSVQMDLWTSDPTAAIQARLYNGDAEASVGESVVVTGAVPTKVDFDVVLNAGQHPYRLQVTSETPGVALFAAGPGLIERPGGEYEEPPVEPDPPPTSTRPSWWKDYDGTIPSPVASGTFGLVGAGMFTQYRWTGVSAIIDNREGPMAFAGDFHGDISPNSGARIEWVEVPGATGYRVYVYNCGVRGELFEPHLHNTELVGDPGPEVIVQFKDVGATPNWGGWPPESGWSNPAQVPDFECDFTSDTDGTSWVMWP